MQIAMFAPKDDESGRFDIEAASSSDEKSGVVKWDVLRVTCPDGYFTLYIETPAQARALVEAVADLERRVNERNA